MATFSETDLLAISDVFGYLSLLIGGSYGL